MARPSDWDSLQLRDSKAESDVDRWLTTWRDGPVKDAIFEFARRVNGDDGSPAVAPDERIAVFDNDGTLWCEKPMPIQLDFIPATSGGDGRNQARVTGATAVEICLRTRLHVAGGDDDRALAGNDTNLQTFASGILTAYDGISVDDFEQQADDFLRSELNQALGRGYVETAYAPMVELLRFLEASGFSNYIASGGGRDFMRPITQDVYGIPRQNVIGSSVALSYTENDAGGTITHKPEADYLDDGPEKPIRIWSRTGRRPILAVGNSNGDIPMLHFTHHEAKPTLRLMILHDDETGNSNTPLGPRMPWNEHKPTAGPS